MILLLRNDKLKIKYMDGSSRHEHVHTHTQIHKHTAQHIHKNYTQINWIFKILIIIITPTINVKNTILVITITIMRTIN